MNKIMSEILKKIGLNISEGYLAGGKENLGYSWRVK
jgi:hypothetical protein